MSLPDFSSRDVQVAFFGVALSGLAPDTFITFSLNSDLTDEEVGADGSLSVSISPDETGTCTITLQQQSLSNSILSGVLAAQRERRTIFRGDLTILDKSGSVLANLTNAHIKTAPEVSVGNTAAGKTREWVFFCEKMHFFQGAGEVDFLPEDAAAITSGINSIINRTI